MAGCFRKVPVWWREGRETESMSTPSQEAWVWSFRERVCQSCFQMAKKKKKKKKKIWFGTMFLSTIWKEDSKFGGFVLQTSYCGISLSVPQSICTKRELILFFFFSPFLFTVVYESSWARGWTEATTVTYTTVTPDLRHGCDWCYSLWQCWILDPLSEAMDRTLILMETTSGL